jgi:hypothetical protein
VLPWRTEVLQGAGAELLLAGVNMLPGGVCGGRLSKSGLGCCCAREIESGRNK